MINTNISDIPLKSCIYNASGCFCTTDAELYKLDSSKAGAILSKSCTYDMRLGNDKPRYAETDYGTINSTGLANNGYVFYRNISKKLMKPYILSVSTLDIDKTFDILGNYAIYTLNNLLVEVNISCPNISGLKQLGYDIEEFEQFLIKLQPYTKILKIGLKLPPYFDSYIISHVSILVLKYGIKFVVCSNSLANGLVLDKETLTPSIVPNSGLGGIGGIYCKPIFLSNVYQFYKYLHGQVDIIGCGGIDSGQDILEYIAAGACAVQVGSHLMKHGPECFYQLQRELQILFKNRKINNIKDIQGCAHVILN